MKENHAYIPEEGFQSSDKADEEQQTENTSWLERFQELFASNKEASEDEETEVDDGKKSRFSRLLSKIFGSIAPKEEFVESDEVTYQHLPEQFEVPVYPSEELPQIAITHEAINEDTIWQPGQTEPIHHDVLEQLPDDESLEVQDTLHISHEDENLAESQVSSDERIPDLSHRFQAETPRYWPIEPQTPSAFEKARIERESRHVRQEARRTAEELRAELDRVKRSVIEKPSLTHSVESLKPMSTVVQERSEFNTGSPSVENKHSKPLAETLPTYIETPPKRTLYEKKPGNGETKVAPVKPVEQVIERVVEAAEHDEAIEKTYELRHEIKGEDQVPQSAVPIGKVVQDALKMSIAKQQALGSTARALGDSQRRQAALSPTTQEMYATAVKNGFYSALGIIIFAIIAYLIMRG